MVRVPSVRIAPPFPHGRPMCSLFVAIACIALAVSPSPVRAEAKEPPELTLRDALALTMERNPELAAFAREIRATEGALVQAGAIPNPVLGIAGENLGNARKAQAGDRTATLQIGQLIELGGKRSARIRLAETARDVATRDYEAKRAEILSRLALRFVDLLAAQDREALAEETLGLATHVADAVAKRVQAGKVSPVEETRARVALASSEVERDQARREVLVARTALAALWAQPDPRFVRAAGELEQLVPLPDYEALADRVRRNPELVRWSSEISRRRASLAVEKARSIPDVTVTAGVARFSELDDHAYLVGVSIPLPFFDTNQGGIAEATQRLDKGEDERRAVEARLAAELSQSWQRLAGIDREIRTLRTTLLPGARSAYEAATRGYELGKFGVLDVLDAQRTLFQARLQHLRALADYHRGVADIERLVGGPMDARTAQAK